MHDECWRDLIFAEEEGHYTRVAIPIGKLDTEGLERWLGGVGINTYDEIRNDHRKKYDVRNPFIFKRRIVKEMHYLFTESENRYVYYTWIKQYLFVWFSQKSDAVMFKTAFGGDS